MVSVCMATYNGEKFIKEQLSSILCQLTEQDEIIISDDGSTDNTLDIIQLFNDPKIKIYRNEKPLGVVKNFERALEKASKNIIFLADQDDIWVEEKVSTCLKFLNDCYVVMSDFSIIDEDGQVIDPAFFSGRRFAKNFVSNLVKNKFVGSCMAFRREILDTALPFPAKIGMHDWWLGLVTSLKFSCIFIEKPLVKHRIHSQNSSTTGNKSVFSLSKRIAMRIRIVFNLFKIM